MRLLYGTSLSAAWYRRKHGLNDLTGRGDFLSVTRGINGGLNGLSDRQARWYRAKVLLGIG
jgi:putative chitinase